MRLTWDAAETRIRRGVAQGEWNNYDLVDPVTKEKVGEIVTVNFSKSWECPEGALVLAKCPVRGYYDLVRIEHILSPNICFVNEDVMLHENEIGSDDESITWEYKRGLNCEIDEDGAEVYRDWKVRLAILENKRLPESLQSEEYEQLIGYLEAIYRPGQSDFLSIEVTFPRYVNNDGKWKIVHCGEDGEQVGETIETDDYKRVLSHLKAHLPDAEFTDLLNLVETLNPIGVE